MIKIYHSSSCSTCQRILKEWKPSPKVILQDIKSEKITSTQLDDMAALAGSYAALFSRIALKYRSMKLNEKVLNEKDYRKLILDEYTFLKRPVLIVGSKIFIGNSPKNVEAGRLALST